MTNWFAGIGQAASGINAARYGLSIVSQNIANADTPGYTRQSANQVATDSTVVSGIYTSRNVTNLMGGTTVASVDRVNDPVLDGRMRDEHARGATADTTAASMSDIEQLLPEPGTDGVAARLDDFWKSWGTLSNNPGDSGTRTAVLTSASAVATSLNSLSASLDGIAQSTSSSLSDDVAQASTAATQLAQINTQIAIASATAQNSNNLQDQRDQLLDKLGKLVGGVATIGPNGAATVTVGGQTLVSGITATTISVDPTSHAVSVGGTAVTLTGGSAAARVTTLTTTIPSYRSQLDAVADAVTTAGNAVQAGGYDLAGNAGTPLFSGSGAGGITVALTDPNKLAASGTTGGNLDGGNALKASQLGTGAGSPNVLYSALVGSVAADSAKAQQLQTTQDAVVSNVDSLRASISGVSYDDEISHMLTYQQSFQASSRVLTTIDQMLDTLINHTGVVGQA